MLLNLERKVMTVNTQKVTKASKVFSKLVSNGETLTEAQARKLGVGNLRAEVHRIRAKGFAIYANRRVSRNGIAITEYRHAEPTRELIAAGYRAMRAKI